MSSARTDGAIVGWLEAGTSPILFTPGSANLHGREFFVAAADEVEAAARRS